MKNAYTPLTDADDEFIRSCFAPAKIVFVIPADSGFFTAEGDAVVGWAIDELGHTLPITEKGVQ